VKHQKGFSLIELLIVVCIILVVAAMAIPSLLRSRMAANEASAVGSIRSINTAMVTYSVSYPDQGYASTLQSLGNGGICTAPSTTNACLIDDTLANATTAPKSGYTFALTVPGTLPNQSYVVGASANTFNSDGVRDFCSIEDGVIRFDTPTSQQTPVTTAAACQAFTTME